MPEDHPSMRLHQSVTSSTDLREMLRDYIIERSMACMTMAGARRAAALAGQDITGYRDTISNAVRAVYRSLPAGSHAAPPQATIVSTFMHEGFRVENVLFETYPGWQVNATVYVPTDVMPPFPVVIVPVGHSGKQFADHQLPCQFFARAGYLTIIFDPPGQLGEKRPGNDHFVDGVRDYLLGECSSRYFVADAIRCIDYAETRVDANLSRGVAMTGVSGGGTTTIFATLLDDRISVIGPSCCATPLAGLDITQCYAGCPETHPWRRYPEGLDDIDLLCAAVPRPCLLMAGEADACFHIDATRRLAGIVADCYAAAGVADRFAFSVDPGGHGYPLDQARAFTRFLHRWLRGEGERPLPDLPDEAVPLLPYEEMRCCPRTDVNMRTLAMAQADALADAWDRSPAAIRRAAAEMANACGKSAVPVAEVSAPFQVWEHDWRAVLLRPEEGIELPGTLLTARRQGAAAAVLHLDEAGRYHSLYRQGLLATALGFLGEERPDVHLLTVDLRGWGDTVPAMAPYEMASWGSLDRYLAYATTALGDPVLAMRTRDALAALTWLRARPEVDPAQVLLTGAGLGSVVALHVAAIDGDVAGVVGWGGLASFRSLIEAESYPWPADAFLPRVLQHYDLPELAGALSCPVRLFTLREGDGKPATEATCALYQRYPHVAATGGGDPAGIVQAIRQALRD